MVRDDQDDFDPNFKVSWLSAVYRNHFFKPLLFPHSVRTVSPVTTVVRPNHPLIPKGRK